MKMSRFDAMFDGFESMVLKLLHVVRERAQERVPRVRPSHAGGFSGPTFQPNRLSCKRFLAKNI